STRRLAHRRNQFGASADPPGAKIPWILPPIAIRWAEVISLSRDDEEKGYRPPYVSPFLPDHVQEQIVRPKNQPRMTWGTSNLAQLGYALAVIGVLLMTSDLIGTIIERFSLVFIWGPMVGATLAVVLWKSLGKLRQRRNYRTRRFSWVDRPGGLRPRGG
ncbi:MAG: hypothetical protein PHU43_10400, partial [Candidatus Bipolaricaulis sp.]|nr:hypothetical protein [Candidatus Bipolaricaulis sp.]